MLQTSRREFIGALALGSGSGVVAARALAAGGDGHAAGYDVAPASNYQGLIPRKSGDPVVFTASLDKGAIKATSGGWAREITTRQLPIAADIAGAHVLMNAGGSREMHWHNSAEWAYVLAGRCQVTVVDSEGDVEVANYGPGDLWFFPKGHAHAMQTIGNEPCHAILAFDDGLYSEHGTFGMSDWISRFDSRLLEQAFGLTNGVLAKTPAAETYIMQGDVIPVGGSQSRSTNELDRARTHHFQLMAQEPWIVADGGALYIAAASDFPMSATMTGMVLLLNPGAIHEPHWHPNANEWHYVVRGQTRVTLFGPDKRMAVADLSAGDCAYLPRGCGHMVQNIGKEDCEVVGVLDSGTYRESSLSAWLAKAPNHLIANNFGISEDAATRFRARRSVITAAI